MLKETYICASCHAVYPSTPYIWKCKCGGLLNIEWERPAFSKEQIQSGLPGMWRYASALPFHSESSVWKDTTMGEGATPLVPLSEEDPHTFVKVDYMMPTLSFKDRGAAVLIAKAKEWGVKKIIADSSGNAGTSFAAYAKRTQMECDIFLGTGTSPKKIAQISAHGANIRMVDGTREEVAQAAQLAVQQEGTFYASHVFNPYFYEGTKTYAYEIWEQLSGAPDTVIIPVGNGTLLLGVYQGFCELLAEGLVTSLPKIVAVQAENCAPLAQAFHEQRLDIKSVQNKGTIAEGIAIAAPARAKQILHAIKQTGGYIVTAKEQEIKKAHAALAEKGFYVEPTTAANYAAYLKHQKTAQERIVLPLCGAGLKAV
ncbi:threonine synthase [Bacillus australimaris]|uniref:Threonine synthase n=1 Tax=Bacillus australimaris TaxID=1326968 RepID=A0ABD4QM44_9BACI|nr:threonine synthase [Bacillus australimaris]KPN13173.1 threonine synthase [Bacillus australimaris]MBR8691113.1 threonine synthase [Bacillus australimaris]